MKIVIGVKPNKKNGPKLEFESDETPAVTAMVMARTLGMVIDEAIKDGVPQEALIEGIVQELLNRLTVNNKLKVIYMDDEVSKKKN